VHLQTIVGRQEVDEDENSKSNAKNCKFNRQTASKAHDPEQMYAILRLRVPPCLSIMQVLCQLAQIVERLNFFWKQLSTE
jgi:hypothetical protein